MKSAVPAVAQNVVKEGGKTALQNVGGWLAKNPGVVTGAMSTGANMMAGAEEGARADEMFAYQQEENERRHRLAQMREMLGMYGMGI